MKPRILVTSAAGRTGSVAVLELLGKGFPVRSPSTSRPMRSPPRHQPVDEAQDLRDAGHLPRPPNTRRSRARLRLKGSRLITAMMRPFSSASNATIRST